MEFEEQPIIFKVIYGGGIGRRWSGKVSYIERAELKAKDR